MNAEEYRRMFEAEDRQWWYVGMRRIARTLLDQAPPLDGRRPRALDAGCGTGRNLADLAQRGVAIGVDLSDEALRFCRSRDVTVTQASLMCLPFPNHVFDWVTCYDVLYHDWVTDDRDAARELARTLRPGGVMLLRVPALKLLWGAHDKAVHSRHRYTRAEVEALLRTVGLTPLKVTYCNSLLFPLVALWRGLDRVLGREGSDVGFFPAPVEWLFRSLLELEARWIRHHSFPIGASVVALALKPRAGDGDPACRQSGLESAGV